MQKLLEGPTNSSKENEIARYKYIYYDFKQKVSEGMAFNVVLNLLTA